MRTRSRTRIQIPLYYVYTHTRTCTWSCVYDLRARALVSVRIGSPGGVNFIQTSSFPPLAAADHSPRLDPETVRIGEGALKLTLLVFNLGILYSISAVACLRSLSRGMMSTQLVEFGCYTCWRYIVIKNKYDCFDFFF